MTHPIKFGTDGWRDIIADNFTFANVAIAAQAHAVLKSGGARVVVGYDTRFASDRFARAVAEVMSANGLEVYLSFALTPVFLLLYFFATLFL